MRVILLFSAMLFIFPAHSLAGGTLPWQAYYFDGQEFRAGVAALGPSVYSKEGYLPVLKATDAAGREDKLPAGTGGVVLFSYLQCAGGKLQSHAGYVPLPGTAIEIRSGKWLMTIRSDGDGYAVLALPSGQYDIRVRGFGGKVQVEKDKTVFLPLRAGKRMID